MMKRLVKLKRIIPVTLDRKIHIMWVISKVNDKALPFFTQQQLSMLRILTDRGTEYCGRMDQHDHQLYLAINDIDHTKTKAQSPQINGICERFHKTILQEFFR